jgi:hypothetical protein
VTYVTHRHVRCRLTTQKLVTEENVPPSPFDPLRPDLREAAETLEQALTEACGSKSAHEANTGELIRVEEMLALAGEAARRAISIRRKARESAGPPGAAAEGTEAPTADQPPAVTHRLFDDAKGVRWDVWPVHPEGRPSQVSALPGTFQTGWLVFESVAEKRRLSPIPSNWQSLPPRELERLCERAEVASRRPRGASGGLGEDTPPRSG